ncbi:MAG: hypothetical protein ACTSRW_08355 [Candidatus Helarchaeota archaeon]
MPVDCSNCVKNPENIDIARKDLECPVNEKYKENHESCDFKETIEQLNERLKQSPKFYCPKHGWNRGWLSYRPVAGSSAPQFRFCPIKGCNHRTRGQ